MNESDSYNSYKLESLFGTNIDRLKFNEARDTLKIELNSFICKQKNIQVSKDKTVQKKKTVEKLEDSELFSLTNGNK